MGKLQEILFLAYFFASTLYSYIKSALDGCFQKKKSSKMVSAFQNNPWFNCECKTHKRYVNDYKRSINIDVEPY